MNNNLNYINMIQYLELLRKIYTEGDEKPNAREGLPGTKSLFGPQMEFDLKLGFPIITTKHVNFLNISIELIWFLKGKQNIKYMVDNGVNIWNEDAYNYFQKLFPESKATLSEFVERVRSGYTRKGTNYRYGDTGNQYPKTWRNFGEKESWQLGINQITRVLDNLREQPNGRRHLVSSIDVQGDQDLALYWCHALFQFNCKELSHIERCDLLYTEGQPSHVYGNTTPEDLDDCDIPKYYLDCKLYQRSADVILGVPYNISSYALLIEIFCQFLNYIPGRFIHTFGDVHLYTNHQEAALTQLARTTHYLPKLKFSDEFKQLCTDYRKGPTYYTKGIWDQLTPQMFSLDNYEHDAPIKATLNTGMKKPPLSMLDAMYKKIEMANGSTIVWEEDNKAEHGYIAGFDPYKKEDEPTE